MLLTTNYYIVTYYNYCKWLLKKLQLHAQPLFWMNDAAIDILYYINRPAINWKGRA
jgi:hypothetical protein